MNRNRNRTNYAPGWSPLHFADQRRRSRITWRRAGIVAFALLFLVYAAMLLTLAWVV